MRRALALSFAVLLSVAAFPASAADEAPPAYPAAPPPADRRLWPPSGGVPLTLESAPPGATFYVRSREFAGWYWGRRRAYRAWHVSYAPLCTAPCTIALPPAPYLLAMSTDDEGIADSRKALLLRQPITLRGEHVSHRTTRTFGWLTLAAGLGGGTFLLVDGLTVGPPKGCTVNCRDQVRTGEVLAGVAAIAGGAIVGAILIGTPDEARLTVVTSSGASRAPGLSLTGAF